MLLAREQADQILALRDRGMTVRAIAHQVGCAQNTVVGYIHRRTTPGQRASPRRALGDFVDYCRRRWTDDPELSTAALFGELAVLGYAGGRSTFYRDLGRYDLLRPSTETVQLRAGRPWTASPISSTPSVRPLRPLPVRIPPIAGELLGSYLERLAAGNHICVEELLTVLPAGTRRQVTQKPDRPFDLNPSFEVEDCLLSLSDLTGVTQNALAHAIPAFTTALLREQPTRPTRLTMACRRCTTIRGIGQPVPVRLPATRHICVQHGIWLSGTDRPQLDINSCPEIIAAQDRTRRLLRRLTPQQLIFAEVTAIRQVQANPTPAWHRRLQLLHTANPSLGGTATQDLVHAATYPDALDARNLWRLAGRRHPSKIY